MLRFFVLFLVLFPFTVLAQGVVKEIHSSNEVFIEIVLPTDFKKDQKVLITGQANKKLVALGTVRSEVDPYNPGIFKVRIEELFDNHLVLVGDVVEIVNYKTLRDMKVPGFNSLTLADGKSTPAEFQELAYFGVFTSEGHTLEKKEVLISPFQVQYGITNDFGVKVVNALWFDGYANLGLKYRALSNKYAKITLNTLGAYKVQQQDWIGQFGGVITVPSNSKFQNHFMFTATFDPQYNDSRATKDLGLFTYSDIRSITEYITDDWDRILYGPVYNVELQTFGGTVSYMWIWSTFHISLGIATKDFTNLTFGPEGYYYVFDAFWRF